MTYLSMQSTHKSPRPEIEAFCETLTEAEVLAFLRANGCKERVSGWTSLAELRYMAEDILFERYIDSEDGSWN